jgi:thiol-disulfide isomerase/thioredoxin
MKMKKYLLIIAAFFTVGMASAQTPEVTKEADGTKILKGFMTKQQLAGDTSFAWYAQNRQGYTPYPAALQSFKTAKDSIYILAFGGTWCSDTKFLLPKFYALAEAAGLAENRITLLGVDRAKTTVYGLEKAFNVTHVPTFIVLKDGKEIGRVVEYGKYGMVDKELGEIVSGGAGK